MSIAIHGVIAMVTVQDIATYSYGIADITISNVIKHSDFNPLFI